MTSRPPPAAPADHGLAQAMDAAADWYFRLQESPRDPELRDALQDWLETDPLHPHAWALAQKAWALTGEAVQMTAAPDFMRPTGMQQRGGRNRIRQGFFAVAACLALAAMLLPLLPDWGADYAAGRHEQRGIALTDGSAVMLGAGSAIDAAFDNGRRGVSLLRGEAFFEVRPDAARPFVVEAGALTVTVTGTAFDVAVSDRSYRVAVASGSVRVALREPGGMTEIGLAPGQRVTVDRASGTMARDSVDPAEVALWRSGRLVVRDMAFADVVDALRRQYRGFILVPSDALAERRVTGVYDMGDPARALRMLAGTYGATVTQYTPFLLVLSPAS
ncbi:FecR domain-containing protein [Ferrovibrio sp.]|uniref:FecR family protein n=1 Tax=Ferrovibrio sp. TaxID=1917215 RepID=UPI0035124656